jgi:hypothetical protein
MNNNPRKVVLTLALYITGLSIGIVMGVRLGLDAVENDLRNEIYHLREDISAQKKCPTVPYPWRDFDLEPAPIITKNNNPPVSL